MLEREYVIKIKSLCVKGEPNMIAFPFWEIYEQYRKKFDHAYHWHKNAPLALYIHCLCIIRNSTKEKFVKAMESISD